MRWVIVVALACACAERAAPPPPRCTYVQVPLASGPGRVHTCREDWMSSALHLCDHEPPLVPTKTRPDRGESAPGISYEECLRQWSKTYDACPDEPDRQWKCVAEATPSEPSPSR